MLVGLFVLCWLYLRLHVQAGTLYKFDAGWFVCFVLALSPSSRTGGDII